MSFRPLFTFFAMFNPFRRTYTRQEKKIFRFLEKNPFFSKLTEAEMAEFLPFMYLRTYEKGEVIFFRGDPSQAFYLVHKGIVVLNIDIADKFEDLAYLKPTESFGDNALLEDRSRIYNAICFSDKCELYVIPSSNIIEIFEDSIRIKSKMMNAMAEYNDRYMANLFRAYQESFGFFDLGMAFSKRN